MSPLSADVRPKSSGIKVLIVDDEPALRSLLKLSLTRVGYEVMVAANGQEALDLFGQRTYDLVLLDVMMPGLDGLEVCRQLRRLSDVPIIMLTGKSQTTDVVTGLNLGADAYITKPFIFKELEAHIAAVLRRVAKPSTPEGCSGREFGDLTLQSEVRRAVIGDVRVELTKLEFDLLAFLAQHIGRPVGKEELLRSVWGYDVPNNHNIVELAIRRLREKIESDPSSPERLVTVRGVGYMFAARPDAANAMRLSSPSSPGAPAQASDVRHRNADGRMKG